MSAPESQELALNNIRSGAFRSEWMPAFLLTASSAAEYIGLGTQALMSAHGAQVAAIGALIGLMTAVLGLSLIAFGGRTQPLISGPRAATVVLMSQTVASLVASPQIGGLGLFAVLACSSLAVVVAGLTQLVLAALRGGTMVRMMPASVLSGLLFGSAVIAVAGQVKSVTPCVLNWTPTLMVVGAGVVAHFVWVAQAERFKLPRGLSLCAALVVSTIVYQIANHLLPATAECRTFGSAGLELSAIAGFGIRQWPSVFAHLDLATIEMLVSHGLVIGLMASLDTLIAVSNLEADSHQRARPDRELAVHGLSNVLSGAVGLLPIVGSLTRSKLAWSAGARTRWTAIIHAGMLLALVVFGTQLLGKLPVLAAASVMIAMAVDMIDDWSKQLTRLSFSDSAPRSLIATATWLFLAVTVATIITGKPDRGFELGCALALLGLIRRPRGMTVRFERTGVRLRVKVSGAMTHLDADRRLIDPILAQIADCDQLEVDMRQVERIDASACKSLRQLIVLLEKKSTTTTVILSDGNNEARAALDAFSVGATIRIAA